MSLSESPRARSLVAFATLTIVAVAAGWGIYAGHRKVLGILALVTFIVLLRRYRFEDFFFIAVAAAVLGHVRIPVIQDEFAVDKWLALFALAIVSVLVVLLHLRRPAWPRLIHLPVVLLVGLSIYSISWSTHPWMSLAKGGVWCLGAFIAFAGAWTYARDLDRVQRIVDAHVTCLWLVFPVCLLAVVVSFPGTWQAGRLRAVFENANNLGEWSSQSLPLLLALALTERRRWWRRAAVALFSSGLLVAFLSGSRGGVLGAAIGMAVFSLLRYRKLTIAAAALGGTVILFLMLYDVRLESLAAGTEHLVRAETLDDLSTRKTAWELGLVVAEQRPWLGHGFGLGDILYYDYGLDVTKAYVPPSVHNTYLDVTMNLGLVGLGLVLAIQALAAWSGLSAWRRDPDGPTGTLALALLCSVIGTSAHAVVETTLLSMGNPGGLPYWVFLALLVRLGLLAREQSLATEATAMAPPALAFGTDLTDRGRRRTQLT